MTDVERLLRSALVPVDPPVSLVDKVADRHQTGDHRRRVEHVAAPSILQSGDHLHIGDRVAERPAGRGVVLGESAGNSPQLFARIAPPGSRSSDPMGSCT